MSKTLARLAAKHPDIIEEIEDDGDNGWWIHLLPGHQFEGCHAIHEMTVKQAVSNFEDIEPCPEGCSCRPRA